MLTLRYQLPWLPQAHWLCIDAQVVWRNNEVCQQIDALAVMSPLLIVLQTSELPTSAKLPHVTFLWLWRMGFQPAHWSALRQLLLHRR